jgi:hypothetical protein
MRRSRSVHDGVVSYQWCRKRTADERGEDGMTMQERRAGSVAVLGIDGDITMGDTGAHRLSGTVRGLVQKGYPCIVLDLARARYVDSAGLGEMVHCCTAVRARGGSSSCGTSAGASATCSA